LDLIATTLHLPEVDDPTDAIDVGDMVSYLQELPGWVHIEDAIAAKVEALKSQLINKPVRQSVGDYERTIGEMRGLESVAGIVAGLIHRAEEAKRTHG
jgi:hypothetical protein